MHASRNQSKEIAQRTTVCSPSRLENDTKLAAFTCFSLNSPKGVGPRVSGLDQSPHTLNRHLALNHPPHRESNNPTRLRGKGWGSHVHSPCRQKRLTKKLVASPTLDLWFQSSN